MDWPLVLLRAPSSGISGGRLAAIREEDEMRGEKRGEGEGRLGSSLFVFTHRVSTGGNAIASVRPSVRPFVSTLSS